MSPSSRPNSQSRKLSSLRCSKGPNDTVKEIAAKLKLYRQCGVPIVWIIDTDLCTVTEHRPGRHPKLFTQADTITGEPHLPGFSCAVAEFFG